MISDDFVSVLLQASSPFSVRFPDPAAGLKTRKLQIESIFFRMILVL